MRQPRKFRKKPVEIEAMLYDEHRVEDILDWVMKAEPPATVTFSTDGWSIVTLEGAMLMTPGDYIIRGVQGEFYPCKPEIFHATYEEVLPLDEDMHGIGTVTANELRNRD